MRWIYGPLILTGTVIKLSRKIVKLETFDKVALADVNMWRDTGCQFGETGSGEDGGGDRGATILSAAVEVAASSQTVAVAISANVIEGDKRNMGGHPVMAMVGQGSER